ncbi:TPA: bifunctional oligoribonuclease/PAP phosphatase NrnA [Candidatus Gracilibacteria bacterium]|nr:bifunctional oligoribonuclease/PAP phosphatase NrnA [Candidatus Gracilibacteria bacterium]
MSGNLLEKRDIDFKRQFRNELKKMYEEIKNATNIVLISHQRPDGDTSGSAMALAHILEKFGKTVTLFDTDPLPIEFQFTEKALEYTSVFEPSKYDLAICLDGGTYKMFGLHEEYPELFNQKTDNPKIQKKIPLINIDHHVSNEIYGDVNIVIETVASTTIMVSKILRALQWEITPEMATCLQMGLYTDTGSLLHSNATSETFAEASFLLKKGSNLKAISKNIFQTKSLEKLKLWGRILSRISQNKDGVASSFVTHFDFQQTKSNLDDLTGVVDYLNAVPKSLYSILLTERKDGKVKGSMRTLRDDVDLTEISKTFDGGGHKKASGFAIKGKLKTECEWRIENAEGYPENFSSVMHAK